MYQTINKRDFVHAFDAMGRGNSFTVAARMALFDYLEELEADTGEPMELDVIAICCDFDELDVSKVNRQFDLECETLDDVIEHLEYADCTVIPVEDEETVILAGY